MRRREPKLCVWILGAMGIQIGSSKLDSSFPLRWALGSMNFMLTWGVIVLIAWSIISGLEDVVRRVLVVLGACVVYGALNASLNSAPRHSR